ncbi:MAG TPA: clostripain-related cysteine peptidase [Albitalea sp.]
MALPKLIFSSPTPGAATSSVTLAVYAPFGTDAVLSTYPNGLPLTITQHPLVKSLVEVSKCGVHVSALIDLYADDSYLVEIPADKPLSIKVTSRWKLEMDAINTLSGFLRHTRLTHPGSALVLALEGHGAGYLPEIDISQLTTANLTQEGAVEWRITHDQGAPLLPMGSPLLPMGSPLLPMGSPLLPVNHMPLSTWGLGEAMKVALAGSGQKFGVIHFNNCFNMAVELLHTVAPHADYAAGYMNYNFFSSGQTYPVAFNKLKLAGSATTQQFATWLAEANRDVLASKSHHPTAGAVVQLSRLPGIAARIDALAEALIAALTGVPAATRPQVVNDIRLAIRSSQQYDTGASPLLESPDELTDLCSLATRLTAFPNHAPVQQAAAALRAALAGIKVYGARATPWTSPNVLWDFTRPDLAMNILCPDPALRGLWDWRSPFYLQVQQEPGQPVVQPHVIDFLKQTAWVDFIIEYHRDVPFRGLLPAAIPAYPIFNRKHGLPDT